MMLASIRYQVQKIKVQTKFEPCLAQPAFKAELLKMYHNFRCHSKRHSMPCLTWCVSQRPLCFRTCKDRRCPCCVMRSVYTDHVTKNALLQYGFFPMFCLEHILRTHLIIVCCSQACGDNCSALLPSTFSSQQLGAQALVERCSALPSLDDQPRIISQNYSMTVFEFCQLFVLDLRGIVNSGSFIMTP